MRDFYRNNRLQPFSPQQNKEGEVEMPPGRFEPFRFVRLDHRNSPYLRAVRALHQIRTERGIFGDLWVTTP